MVQIFGNSQMLIGGDFLILSQFKKFLSIVLHRNVVGKNQLVEIGSFAPPGINALDLRKKSHVNLCMGSLSIPQMNS